MCMYTWSPYTFLHIRPLSPSFDSSNFLSLSLSFSLPLQFSSGISASARWAPEVYHLLSHQWRHNFDLRTSTQVKRCCELARFSNEHKTGLCTEEISLGHGMPATTCIALHCLFTCQDIGVISRHTYVALFIEMPSKSAEHHWPTKISEELGSKMSYYFRLFSLWTCRNWSWELNRKFWLFK